MRLTALTLTLALALTASPEAVQADPYKLKDGVLQRPVGYREWVYVGTPVTPNDMNDGKAAFPEHHNVYMEPKSWAHWKKTGEFRDGTILIKELVSVLLLHWSTTRPRAGSTSPPQARQDESP